MKCEVKRNFLHRVLCSFKLYNYGKNSNITWMKQHKKILKILYELRQVNPIIQEIFLNGSCMNLFHILKTIFPKAKCYYNQRKGHVATEINGKLYDITGELNDNLDSYIIITEIWNKPLDKILFGDMYVLSKKKEYKLDTNSNNYRKNSL